MGEESVILCRDRQGEIHVFLNSCRHRGMKVCRYDEGNTVCSPAPTTAGATPPTARLVGVPFAKDAYGEQLDKSKWGLVEVAQMTNYKGTIWATWDPAAPPFLDYLGGYKLYLDLLLDAWDGREGGTEVIGGIHKWLIPCNWKFPAENFSGDRYHGVSHRSVDLVGIGPSGKGRRGHAGAQRARAGSTCPSPEARPLDDRLLRGTTRPRPSLPGRAGRGRVLPALRGGAQRRRRAGMAASAAPARCSPTRRPWPGSRARSPSGIPRGAPDRGLALVPSTPTRRPRSRTSCATTTSATRGRRG